MQSLYSRGASARGMYVCVPHSHLNGGENFFGRG